MEVVLNEPNVLQLFSKPVWCVNTNILNDKLIEEIKNLKYERVAVDNGWSTKDKDVLLRFPELRQYIINEFHNFTYNYFKILNEFDITSSWAMIHNKGDFAQTHNHQNSIFSGVLYIQTYENSGGIKFHNFFNGLMYSFNYEESNMNNSNSWNIKPRSGQMIFFPSDLYHSVEENQNENDRYCIAFNFFLKELNDEGLTRQINLKLM